MSKFNKIIYYKYIYFILFILYLIITPDKINIIYNFNENETIKKSKNNEYLKIEMINKFNSFIKLCINNFTIENQNKYKLKKKPKISVIMPIYNGGKYLYYSLRSIQNQNMKNIEIILIDDYSIDNSIKIIEKYMKEDERIRLIKNNKNKKILYSKSIAALNSNGDYIIELDQDDIFIRDDVMDILYLEAITHDLDLVQMRDFVKKSFLFSKITKVNIFGLHLIHPKRIHYKTQPILKENLFINNNNYLLWGILIKTDLYKKAIYRLWPLIINYQIIFNEDYIITFMIIIIAKKYKYINKFGLIHLSHKKCSSYEYWKKKEFYLSLYFFVYSIYTYYIRDNPQDIKILVNYITIDINSFKKGKFLFPNLFEYIIKLLFNNDYLLYKDKINILSKLNVDINKYIKNRTDFIDIYNFQEIIKNNINITNINKNEKLEFTILIYCIDFNSLDITLNSIKYQINITYEIIIINDNNDIIHLNDIKKYKDINVNIKIINNKKRKGLMFSYSLGALNSKGNYILMLQSGHTLSYKNILYSLYSISFNNNIDFLEFNLLLNNQNNINSNSSTLNEIFNLNYNIYFKSMKNNINSKEINEEVIFNKIIKSESYKNIIIKYNLTKYNEIIYKYYGNILKILFNKNKLKYYYVNIFGVVENINNIGYIKMKNIINNKNQTITDAIFYIDFLFNISDHQVFEKKIVLKEFINLMSIIFNRFTKLTYKSIKLYKKFLKCKFFSNEDKNELQFFFKSLLN